MALVLAHLDPERDLGAVEAVYRRAADYLDLESGLSPEAAARAFFEERPPARIEREPLHLGVGSPDGPLAAIIALTFGYPEPDDAYLGLLLLVPDARRQGLGKAVLAEVKRLARASGASRLLVGVIDTNSRARVFWERQGFTLVLTSGPHSLGKRQHVIHRYELQLTTILGDCT